MNEPSVTSGPRDADSDYRAHIAELGASLGIASDYALRRGFRLQRETSEAELVIVGVNDDGRDVRLAPAAAASWQKMHAAARQNGIELLPISGFRSVARQAEIIRDKLAAGRTLEEILRYVAAPGYSEHHTGRAIDIGAPDEPALEEGFALTAAFAWLSQHAAEFGFHLTFPRGNTHGIGYEPWHWCWQG